MKEFRQKNIGDQPWPGIRASDLSMALVNEKLSNIDDYNECVIHANTQVNYIMFFAYIDVLANI